MSTASRIQELYDQGGTSEVSAGVMRKLACDVAPQIWTLWHLFAEKTIDLEFHGEQYRYWVDTPQELKRYKTLMGERHILEDLLTNLESDDVFFDIGANTGLYTVPAADRCETVAFDPVAMNGERIRTNLALNGLDAEYQTVALGETSGTTDIYLSNGPIGGGTSVVPPAETDGVLTVPLRSVDGLVSDGEIPAPTVVKIDVEGAERQVLNGMKDTLDDIRMALIEVHCDQLRELDSSSSDVLEILVSAGFDVTQVNDLDEYNSHILAIAE